MIKNIVFDMGNVLVEFDPFSCLGEYGADEEQGRQIVKHLFGGDEWKGLDRGTITDEEALKSVLAKAPKSLHQAITDVLRHWDKNVPLIEEMEVLVKELKEKGYSIYLLSNASKRFHQYKDRITALTYFDGLMISADYLLLKPEIEIYHKLCEIFSLKEEECFFIDDLQPNIEGARKAGMRAFQFLGDITKLREELSQIEKETVNDQ